MKCLVLLYNSSCIYEIVTLNYFLNYTNKEVAFVSMDGSSVTAMEGYSINVNMSLNDVNISEIELLVITGGDIVEIDNKKVYELINKVNENGGLIAGICAGVDVLEHSGVLLDRKTTQNTDLDVVIDNNIITARANAHIDFAIEVGKKLDLFEDEQDIQETIEFFKEHKRME